GILEPIAFARRERPPRPGEELLQEPQFLRRRHVRRQEVQLRILGRRLRGRRIRNDGGRSTFASSSRSFFSGPTTPFGPADAGDDPCFGHRIQAAAVAATSAIDQATRDSTAFRAGESWEPTGTPR